MGSLARVFMVVVIAGTAASCFNPVHADAVAAMGAEAPGVSPGERHRPGQACLVCHGGDGPGPDFVAAGTIYATRDGTAALPGVSVVLTDSASSSVSVTTNSVGNFYITKRRWTPQPPIFVRLDYAGGAKPVSKEMISRIGGLAGCATCHYGNADDRSHMPHAYLSEK